MPKLRVHCFSVSLDGFSAGPHQSTEHPMGVGGMALHTWALATRTFRQTHADMDLPGAREPGTTGVDDDFVKRGFDGVGAWILGRNMFGPIRGPWHDDAWKGWWGETPPFHAPVFVLTHHARASLTMKGGTVFHFVTGGIHEAYQRAIDAAAGQDVRLGGGANTFRQYLAARLIDEAHLACCPTLLGIGEHLLSGVDFAALGYRIAEHATSPSTMHVVIRRSG